MRGFTVSFLLNFFVLIVANAQTYHQDIFDSLGWDKSVGFSTSNQQIAFAWSESGHMESLIDMYQVTHNIKYLQVLIQCIANVIDRRDDLRDQIGLELIKDYRGEINATWSNNYYNKIRKEGPPYAHLVHSANITYSMIKLAALIRSTPHLLHVTALANGRYADMKFSHIADDLVIKTIETLNSHEDQWTYNAEVGWHYRERCDVNVPISYGCEVLPMNMHAFVGRTFVQLYLATKDTAYLERADHIATFIHKYTSVDEKINAKKWKYWGVYSATNELPDDISHAAYTARFPMECYQNNLTHNGKPLFTYEDVVQYANTFTKGIYKGPLTFYGGVDYHYQWWNFKTGEKKGNAGSGSYDCIDWLPYAEIQPEILQIILDNYTSKYYDGIVSSRKHHLTLALLAKYEKHFLPFAADHSWTNDIDWDVASSGNFDADESEELIAVSNDNRSFYLIKTSKDSLNYTDSLKLEGRYHWVGLAAGNFLNVGADQIVALSNHADGISNGIYLFTVSNGKLTLSDNITRYSSRSTWTNIVAGDFIEGGHDEFITIHNNEIFICNLDKRRIKHRSSLIPKGSFKIKTVKSGNFDSDAFDELAVLSSSPAGIDRIAIFDVTKRGYLNLVATYTAKNKTKLDTFTNADLNGDGVDELVAQSAEGKIQIFEVWGRTISLNGSEYFPASQMLDVIMCAGNFNRSEKKDEMIMLRNSDGAVVCYNVNYKNSDRYLAKPVLAGSAQTINEQNDTISRLSTPEFVPEISIYPNPSTGLINIKMQTTKSKLSAYRLYDSNGNEIARGYLDNGVQSIDLMGQKNGSYFLKVISGDQLRGNKFVLQK